VLKYKTIKILYFVYEDRYVYQQCNILC